MTRHDYKKEVSFIYILRLSRNNC